jgi:hypothetical protein
VDSRLQCLERGKSLASPKFAAPATSQLPEYQPASFAAALGVVNWGGCQL